MKRDAPEVEIPEAGQYLWDWYFELADWIGQIGDGVRLPIPPSEWLSWRDMTGKIVYAWEFAILAAMDDAYCTTMTKELTDRHYTIEAMLKGK